MREYRRMRCSVCGHVVAQGPADADLLREVYAGHFHRTSQQYAAWPKDKSDIAMQSAAPVVRNAYVRARDLNERKLSGRLLDIGAGCGYFVRAASAWFDAEGLDVSAQATEVAHSFGANVHCADFMTADIAAGRYDIVTLWDVLAGFADPAAALERIATLIKPGGTLIMTVPDAGSRIARSLGGYWPLFIPPINLNYFTTDSLQRLLQSAGFELEGMRHDAKRVALDFVVVKALRTLGFANVQTVGLPARLAVSLDLGDILTATARRRLDRA